VFVYKRTSPFRGWLNEGQNARRARRYVRVAMKHAVVYHGSMEANHALLEPGVSTFVGTDGQRRALPTVGPSVNGIQFGYMERTGKKRFIVLLRYRGVDLVLANPVSLEPIRHLGGQRLMAAPAAIGDDLATAILDDVIEANPSQAPALGGLISRVNVDRRG
jgi:hypothetical protein